MIGGLRFANPPYGLSTLRPFLQKSLNVRFTLKDLFDVVADSIVQLLGPIELS
jgi:hypothetical protein